MVKMNADPTEAIMLSAAEKARDDRLAGEYWARIEGRDEMALEIAKKLLQRNLTVVDAADLTGASIDQVQALRDLMMTASERV